MSEEIVIVEVGTIGLTGPQGEKGDTGDVGPAGPAATDHAALTHLSYASAGHTGFAGTGVSNVFSQAQQITSSLNVDSIISSGTSVIVAIQSSTIDSVQLHATAALATIIPFKVKGFAAQTANLINVLNSSDAVLSYVAADGSFHGTVNGTVNGDTVKATTKIQTENVHTITPGNYINSYSDRWDFNNEAGDGGASISAGMISVINDGEVVAGFFEGDGSGLTGLDAAHISTGTLPIARGGTNAVTANAGLNNLLPSQTANKPLLSDGTNTSFATLPIAGGGTNAVTANAGLNNLLPSQTANKPLISDGTNTSFATLPIAGGGTNAVTANAGLNNLLPSQSANKPLLSDGTNTSFATLPIAGGGTGATTQGTAISNLVPSTSGNSGKFLTNNGSTTISWAAPTTQFGSGTATSYASAVAGYSTTDFPSFVTSNSRMLPVPSIGLVTWDPTTYTWTSQGSSSFSKKSAYATTFTIPYTAGEQLRNLHIGATNDITVSAWIDAAMFVDTPSHYVLAGICISDSSQVKKYRFAMMMNSTSGTSLIFQYFTNDTTASANISQIFLPLGRPIFLQMLYSVASNNITASFSFDGINVKDMPTTAGSVTSNITPAWGGLSFENNGYASLSQTFNVSNVQVSSGTAPG